MDACCVLQLLERTNVAITGKKSYMSRAFAGDDDIDEDDDSELFTVCSQIAAEEELLAPVHEALRLWESCFQDYRELKNSVFCDRTVDWTVSIDYIEVLVMIYKLMEVSIIALLFALQCNYLFEPLICIVSVLFVK